MGSKRLFDKQSDDKLEFADVEGEESVKRAREIAAAGQHNALIFSSILLFGIGCHQICYLTTDCIWSKADLLPMDIGQIIASAPKQPLHIRQEPGKRPTWATTSGTSLSVARNPRARPKFTCFSWAGSYSIRRKGNRLNLAVLGDELTNLRQLARC